MPEKRTYYENEYPHDKDLKQPYLEWVRSTKWYNVVIFGHSIGHDDNIHMSINQLKRRIDYRRSNGMSTDMEWDALNRLKCYKCTQDKCNQRTETPYYRFDLSNADSWRDTFKEIDVCIKAGTALCHPFCEDRTEDVSKIYTINIEYYFDVTPNNKKTDTFEIEGTKRDAIKKALAKWPNSRVISYEEAE